MINEVEEQEFHDAINELIEKVRHNINDELEILYKKYGKFYTKDKVNKIDDLVNYSMEELESELLYNDEDDV